MFLNEQMFLGNMLICFLDDMSVFYSYPVAVVTNSNALGAMFEVFIVNVETRKHVRECTRTHHKLKY